MVRPHPTTVQLREEQQLVGFVRVEGAIGKKLGQRDRLEDRDADDLEDLVQTLGQAEILFSDGNQEVGADRCPDLQTYRILTSAQKGSQAQMLFDPLKEQFHLPASAIELSHGYGG